MPVGLFVFMMLGYFFAIMAFANSSATRKRLWAMEDRFRDKIHNLEMTLIINHLRQYDPKKPVEEQL